MFPPPISLVPSKAEGKPEHKDAETKLKPSGPDSPSVKKNTMVFEGGSAETWVDWRKAMDELCRDLDMKDVEKQATLCHAF
jgi:hypothetical protein